MRIDYIRACDQDTGEEVMAPIRAELLDRAQRNREEALRMIRSYESKLRTAEVIINTLDECKTDSDMV